jgi:hypothetical protein
MFGPEAVRFPTSGEQRMLMRNDVPTLSVAVHPHVVRRQNSQDPCNTATQRSCRVTRLCDRLFLATYHGCRRWSGKCEVAWTCLVWCMCWERSEQGEVSKSEIEDSDRTVLEFRTWTFLTSSPGKARALRRPRRTRIEKDNPLVPALSSLDVQPAHASRMPPCCGPPASHLKGRPHCGPTVPASCP